MLGGIFPRKVVFMGGFRIHQGCRLPTRMPLAFFN